MVLPRLLFGLFASILGYNLPDKSSESSKRTVSKRVEWSNNLDARSFAFGIAIGMTIYGIGSSQIRRHRIRERMRASYIAWAKRLRQSGTPLASMPYAIMSYLFQLSLDDNEHDGTEANNSLSMTKAAIADHNQVTEALQLKATPIGALNCPDATKRILGSPSISLTSTLHCCLITLPSYSRLRSQEARGVEIYYILDGSSVLCRAGEEDVQIHRGDTFTVNPFVQRHIINKGRNELVFFRVSDGGSECDDDEYDFVVKLDNARRRTVDLILEGFSAFSN
eukprot:CAMPEP_0196810396 /NCGR_PEP_ID=MMETSP1362-20130617/10225_1 /TAXON_ID=163516 /ORGANISM="Leptocylindrus danicus, Strain CCMP1856" /LENGTH=279 /DNA_ID=CAMNT_0042185377 /DNA_START=160 /DNA_END=999 /DNA_ORIENTATION=-